MVLINLTMAKLFWPSRSPIGGRIKAPSDKAPWLTIVGEVADVK